MYAANYMAAPYGGAHYYMPPPYQNGAMPGPAAYMPYPNAAYGRSPQAAMQHFMPMQAQPYGRPPQHSPIVSSPYHPPPPAAAPVVSPMPHTPSSTHSHVAPPPTMTSPVQQLHEALPHHPVSVPMKAPQPQAHPEPQQQAHVPQKASVSQIAPPGAPAASSKQPFRPPVSFQICACQPLLLQNRH